VSVTGERLAPHKARDQVRDSFLRDQGFDLDLLQKLGLESRGVYRLVMTSSGGGHKGEFYLIQGSFEADKARATLKQISRAAHDVEGLGAEGRYYEVEPALGNKYYAAVVGPGTVAHAPESADIIHALEKAAGTRKSELTDKNLRRLISELGPRGGFSLLLSGSCTLDPKGASIREAFGIVALDANIKLGEGLDFKTLIHCTTEERARDARDLYQTLLKFALGKDKSTDALVKALTDATSSVDRQTLTLERHLSGMELSRLLNR
jgi:hypothetical protein